MSEKTIIVKTQKDLDKIKLDFEWRIEIRWDIETYNIKFNNAYVVLYWSIKSMYGYASIEDMYGSASIQDMYDSASIEDMYGYASIKSMYDSASINLMTWLASIILLKSAKKIVAKWMNLIRQIGIEKIDMELWKDVNFIQIKDTIENNPTFNMYQKLYPVEIKKTKAILYKSVHKINWEYVSDYDRNFKYEIWKTIKEKCDTNQNDSCSQWIHISHLQRAIDFGRSRDDVAILECEVPIKDIVVSKDCDWKVRTSQLKVLRELPKEER